MNILSKQEFEKQKEEFYEQIMNGAVFIYPTDTVYGIGCNAEDKKAVALIRKIKKRKDTPFSVIAPSIDWIEGNCVVDGKSSKWVGKLPGPYTLILKKKNECVASNVAPSMKTLGVRMPKHWFLKHVEALNVPIITTSVNKHGQEYMTSLDNLDEDISKKVAFIIYEGEKNGKPSKLVDFGDKFKIIER